MIKLLFIVYLVSSLLMGNADHRDGIYDVWAGPGLHIMMSDNGTPEDLDDDFVVDWETNRTVFTFVMDR